MINYSKFILKIQRARAKYFYGIAFRCKPDCRLYVAESNQVDVYDYDAKQITVSHKRKIVDLPGGGRHFTRTLLFMHPPQDNKLFISVGSSCDVCYEKDWRRAKILVCGPNGENLRTFASGLRNSVFMAIHPVTGKIWATEMGRDYLGDDLPPDEINIVEEGKDYGWPLCYGRNVHDAAFDAKSYVKNPCSSKTPSYIDIPAHSAPLGLAFFPQKGWPPEFRHNLLVAYHGSWNRSVPTGYKIVRYMLDEKGNYVGKEDFISGWLAENGKVIGRPVDILIRSDGVIFVSDDKDGVIYAVKCKKE